VLAVAQDCLSEADWLDLHSAFARQRGSLAAAATAAGHRALLDRILRSGQLRPLRGDREHER